MIKNMKIVREVKKMGDSLFIRLGKDVQDTLKVYQGTIVEAEISKIVPSDDYETYKVCAHCDTPISVKYDEKNIKCPICNKFIEQEKIMSIKCPDCGETFESELDDVMDCPYCQREILESEIKCN